MIICLYTPLLVFIYIDLCLGQLPILLQNLSPTLASSWAKYKQTYSRPIQKPVTSNLMFSHIFFHSIHAQNLSHIILRTTNLSYYSDPDPFEFPKIPDFMFLESSVFLKN